MASLAVLSLDLPGCDAVRGPLAREDVTMLRHPASDELVVVHSLRAHQPLCVDTHEGALAHLGPRWGSPRGLGPKGGPRVNPERFVGLQGQAANRPGGPEDEPVPPIHGDRADDPVPPIHGHGTEDPGDGLRPGSGGHPSDGDRAVAVRVTSLAL
ncbi:MAG: hypothetical protein IT371_02980 [Deltaproteobacteria bacterium]|nr:hypothetical protein [Deltaproteobacteria bacterium]